MLKNGWSRIDNSPAAERAFALIEIAKIANYLKELTVEVGNGPRPRMNGTKPARAPKTAVP